MYFYTILYNIYYSVLPLICIVMKQDINKDMKILFDFQTKLGLFYLTII